jgi:hypothetical protein
MFFEVTLAGAVDFADQLLTDFGGAAEALSKPREWAPTLTKVSYASNTAGAAHQINIYLATAAGQFGTSNMERVVTVNALTTPAVANYAALNGGQGGCIRAHRLVNATPMELRVTTTGKLSTATIYVEWQWARGMT